jgi:hypothetical protein
MAMLLMKKVFFEAIRSGGKTTTLRYWRRRQVRPGSLQTIRGLGKVRIDEATCVKFADLTDADAQADGLADLKALKTALHDLYPPARREGRKLYLVRFTLEEDGKQTQSASPLRSPEKTKGRGENEGCRPARSHARSTPLHVTC